MRYIILVMIVLLTTSCKTGQELLTDNANVCDDNGGIVKMIPTRDLRYQLFFCMDKSVKWGD